MKRINTLSSTFQKDKSTYTLIKRTGDVATYYKKLNLGGDCYETVIINYHDAYKLGTNTIEAGECLPSNSQWGTHGFTYNNEDDALTKHKELVKNNKHIKPTTKQKRGRKPSTKIINFPKKFTIKQLADLNNISTASAYIATKKNKKVRVLKQSKGKRGKPTITYTL
jgi:hypothetical protein